MKGLILVIAFALSAVVVSLGYNIKNETGMSELVEDNIEALCLETQDDYPCLRNPNGKCMEWFVLSDGSTGIVEYDKYIDYMEVDE